MNKQSSISFSLCSRAIKKIGVPDPEMGDVQVTGLLLFDGWLRRPWLKLFWVFDIVMQMNKPKCRQANELKIWANKWAGQWSFIRRLVFYSLEAFAILRTLISFSTLLISSAMAELILEISARVSTSFWYWMVLNSKSFSRSSKSRILFSLDSFAAFLFLAIVDIFCLCRPQEMLQNSQVLWCLIGFVQMGLRLPEMLRKHSWLGGDLRGPLPIGTEQPPRLSVNGPR